MKSIGIREAKGRLSELLRDVRGGSEWVITERGIPIAKLVAIRPEHLSLSERVHRLEAAGVLDAPSRSMRPLPPPLRLEPGLAQRWLREDRSR